MRQQRRRLQLSEVVRGRLVVAGEALLLESDGEKQAAVEKWRGLLGRQSPRP